VPGYVAGLWQLHQRYGKLPWRSLVLPAAETAQQGFAIGAELAAAIAASADVLPESGRALFIPNGKSLKQGDILVRPALANTLRRIAEEGPGAFYKGPIAKDIATTVQRSGGRMTEADLAAYRPRDMAVLQGQAFGLATLTMPQPSAGGAQVLAMAELLDLWGRSAPPAGSRPDRGAAPTGDAPQTSDWTAHALTEAMRRSFLLRLAFAGDAAHPAATLDESFPVAARTSLAATFDWRRATPSAVWTELAPAAAVPEHGTNTSHVSIIDGHGMAASSTHTVNLYLGSGIIAPESGVLLNNEMDDFTYSVTESNAFGLAGSAANLARPGARPVSSMAPLIVLKDGVPVLVAGTPGGTRIPTTLLQVLAWHVGKGWPLAAAVAQVRLHHQAFPDQVGVESGGDGDRLQRILEGHGHTVTRRGPWCNVQAVGVDRSQGPPRFQAVSDPRGEGMAVAE